MSKIPNLEAHGKHLAYTMTIAAGGFAYTDATYDDGDKFLGLETLGSLPAAAFTSFLTGIALVCFLAALVVGVLAIFGQTGISQLTAHKEKLEASIAREEMVRNVSGEGTSEEERDLRKRLEDTVDGRQRFVDALARRSNTHLKLLIFGFFLAGVLFVDSKIDPNKPVEKCAIELNEAGVPIIPMKCAS